MKPIHFLVVFVTLTHMGMSATRVVVPLDAIHLKASPMVVGILVGLFAIVPTLLSVAIGRMVDRVGTRTPLVVFLLLMVTGLVPPWLWPDSVLPLYFAALVVGGACFALLIVHTALAGHYSKPEERATNFALISLGYATSNGLGPLLAGFSIDHAGYGLTYLLLMLLPLSGLVLFLAGKLPQRGPAATTSKSVAKRSVMQLWRDPRMAPIFMISIYFMLLWDIFMVMTPIHGAQLGISASEIGIIMGTFSAAAFLVRTLVAPLSRRFTPMQLLLISLAFGAGAMLFFGIANTTVLLVIAAFAMGAGNGLGGPMVTTALFDASPPDRISEATGLRMSVGMACQAFLPLLMGAVASLVGVGVLFWMVAAVLGFGVWRYRGQWHVDLRAAGAGQPAKGEKNEPTQSGH